MSSMASNYYISKLLQGQGIAALSVVCALATASMVVDTSFSEALPLATIILAYGIMMFASSYVEEEQHFWYWATTAWFAFLGLKRFKAR